MDIQNIIKRLQDIDKLKLVLFDDKQRRVFDILPKPGIALKLKPTKSSVFTVEKVINSKRARCSRGSCKKFDFLNNGEPMNKRMLQMVEAHYQLELETVKEKGRQSFLKYLCVKNIYKGEESIDIQIFEGYARPPTQNRSIFKDFIFD